MNVWGTHSGYFVIDLGLLAHTALLSLGLAGLAAILLAHRLSLRERLLLLPWLFLAFFMLTCSASALFFDRPVLVIESIIPLSR